MGGSRLFWHDFGRGLDVWDDWEVAGVVELKGGIGGCPEAIEGVRRAEDEYRLVVEVLPRVRRGRRNGTFVEVVGGVRMLWEE